MFISHASVELLFRLVVTGEPGSGAPALIDAAHALFGGEPPTTRTAGTWLSREHTFVPQGLGPVRGYTIRMLLHGIDATGPGVDPCNLSGFRDVDGLLVLGPPSTLEATLARCAANVAALGYSVQHFPLVVGATPDGATPDLPALALRFGIGERPVLVVSPSDRSSVGAAVKASLKQMLVALRDGHVRTVEGTRASSGAGD